MRIGLMFVILASIYANMTASSKSHYHLDPLKLISLRYGIRVKSERIKSKVNEKNHDDLTKNRSFL